MQRKQSVACDPQCCGRWCWWAYERFWLTMHGHYIVTLHTNIHMYILYKYLCLYRRLFICILICMFDRTLSACDLMGQSRLVAGLYFVWNLAYLILYVFTEYSSDFFSFHTFPKNIVAEILRWLVIDWLQPNSIALRKTLAN